MKYPIEAVYDISNDTYWLVYHDKAWMMPRDTVATMNGMVSHKPFDGLLDMEKRNLVTLDDMKEQFNRANR